MHEVLVNRLGGLSLPRKSVVRLTDRPDMTLDVYRGRKTTIQYNSSESSARQRIHMKNQTLFSSKDKSKKLKCRLLQCLFGPLRVKG